MTCTWALLSGGTFEGEVRITVMKTALRKGVLHQPGTRGGNSDPGREKSLCKGIKPWVVHDGERGGLKGKQRQAQGGAWVSDYRVYWVH